jgi:hypothetical protein
MLPQGVAALMPCTIYAASKLNEHIIDKETKKDLPQTISDASFVQITLIMVAKFALVTYFYIVSDKISQSSSGLLFAGECALLPICTAYLRPHAVAKLAAFCLVGVNVAATVATVYYGSRESTFVSWAAVGSSLLHTLGSVAYTSVVQNPNITGSGHQMGYTPLSQTENDTTSLFDHDLENPVGLHQNILYNRAMHRPPPDSGAARIKL